MAEPRLAREDYNCTGPLGAGAPALVAVHGWGLNARVWDRSLPALRARGRLSLIELPGHGRSPAPAAADDVDDWVWQLLAAAPDESAYWLGWSLGGLLALRLAELAPDRVLGLVLIASTPRFTQAEDWGAAVPPAILTRFEDQLAGDLDGTLRRFLGFQCLGGACQKDDIRQLSQAACAAPTPAPVALQQGLRILATADLRPQLARVTRPMVWVLGEHDALVPVALASVLPALSPRAEVVVVPGAAHAPVVSHPEVVAQALSGVQRRVASGEAA